MKSINLSMILLATTCIIMTSCAQSEKNNAPAEVLTAFAEKFPDAKKIKWDKENENEWEAEFKMSGKEFSANFSTDGNWKETEYEIKKSDIPAKVQQTLDSEFSEYKIEEAEISETSEGKVYEFELEKGESNIEVVMNTSGEVVKKEVMNDDED